METTKADLGLATEGYLVVAKISKQQARTIYDIQQKLGKKFGEESFWFPNTGQLHVTIAHVITPEAKYSIPNGKLFKQISAQLLTAIRLSVQNFGPFEVSFKSTEAFPAAIIMKGEDSGEINGIRQRLLKNFELPKETRRPPEIIHTTIARFRKALNLDEVQSFVISITEKISLPVSEIFLIRENKIYIQEYDILETFKLGNH